MKLTLFLLLGGSFASGADRGDATLRPILEAHRWFELRDAVSGGQAPTLYRGIVAAAFNDIGRAENELRAEIRSGAGRDDQYAAHEALFNLYLRNGLYRKAAMEARRKWALSTEKIPSETERNFVQVLERLTDLAVVSREPASVAYTAWDGGEIVTPVAINGRAARFVLDTDSNMSVISDAEAKRLGMRMLANEVPVHGVTGSNAPGGKMAVADRVVIGKTELRNVMFLVLGDDQQPFAEHPLGERGVLGVPVMLAVQTLRWNREHRLDLGFKPHRANRQASNLCFEGMDPLTEVEVGTRKIAFVFDTGGENSEAWPEFGKEFPALLQGGKKDTRERIGYSGSAKLDAAILPELRMTLGSFPIVFRDAPVLLATTVGASKWHYGRIGLDLINEAKEVTIDFKAMRVVLK